MASKKRKNDSSEKTRGRRKINEDAEPTGFLSKRKIGKAKTSMVTCTLLTEDAEWLSEFASENGLNRSELVKQCIVHSLEELGHTLPSMD